MSEPFSPIGSWPTRFSRLQAQFLAKQEIVIPTLLTLLAGFFLFWKLGNRSLVDWDEAIYAQIAKEIIHSGQWLTLQWGYQPWFHKPPLFMWLTSVAYHIFGIGELGARSISAAAGAGLVLFTYLIGKTAFDRTTALLASLALGLSYAFVFFARFGTTDITLTFLVYGAIYLYGQAVNGKQRAWYGVWVAIALAFLTKGLAAAVAPVVLFIALPLQRRFWVTLKTPAFWWGGLLAAILVLPWHIAMVSLHGQAFIDVYLLYHVVQRATSGIEGNEGDLFFYFNILRTQFFPWCLLLPVALWMQVKQLPKDRSALVLPLLILVVLVLGGYTLASTKLAWYIIPIYPALAIWIGALLSQVFQRPRSAAFWGLVIGAISTATIFPTKVVFLSPLLKSGLSIAFTVGVALLVAGQFWRRSLYQPVAIALCLLIITAGLREIRGLYTGGFRPEAKLAQAISLPYNPSNPPVIAVKQAENLYMPTILFYSNRPVHWIREAEDLDRLSEIGIKDLILARADIEQIPAHYRFKTLKETGKLAYGQVSLPES
jgi:4-amino-4-deoxy-L-arabinose transferase-like glycosyltransferase